MFVVDDEEYHPQQEHQNSENPTKHCSAHQYGSDIAEPSALWGMKIKWTTFNLGILANLLGKSIPNTHFTEIFFSLS